MFRLIKLELTRFVFEESVSLGRIILTGCKTVREIQSMGRQACGHVADVSKLAEVEGLIDASVKNLGKLDVFIANAGIAQVKSLLSLTEAEVRRMFEINVFGVFNCYSAAAKQMIKQGGGGKIVGAARYVQTPMRLVDRLLNSIIVSLLSNHSPCFPTTALRSLLCEASLKHLRWKWQNTKSLSMVTHQELLVPQCGI